MLHRMGRLQQRGMQCMRCREDRSKQCRGARATACKFGAPPRALLGFCMVGKVPSIDRVSTRSFPPRTRPLSSLSPTETLAAATLRALQPPPRYQPLHPSLTTPPFSPSRSLLTIAGTVVVPNGAPPDPPADALLLQVVELCRLQLHSIEVPGSASGLPAGGALLFRPPLFSLAVRRP